MCGPNWPHGGITLITSLSFLTHFLLGEIDIIEGVHDQTFNLYTLHTTPGCTLDTSQTFTGTPRSTDCDTAVNFNSGCGIEDTDAHSYGSGLNDQGGGVFATLWDGDGIRICTFFPHMNDRAYVQYTADFSLGFFPHCAVPPDIVAETPDPSKWMKPKAFWAKSSCPSSFFHSLTITFDITLCGDWAGATYNAAGYSGSCAERVADPANFGSEFISFALHPW
jgi:hypothetical protein